MLRKAHSAKWHSKHSQRRMRRVSIPTKHARGSCKEHEIMTGRAGGPRAFFSKKGRSHKVYHPTRRKMGENFIKTAFAKANCLFKDTALRLP